MAYVPTLKKKYLDEVVPALVKEMSYKKHYAGAEVRENCH